jgi:hypothetical protein
MHVTIALSQLLWPFDLEVISFFPIAPMQLWEQNSEILFQGEYDTSDTCHSLRHASMTVELTIYFRQRRSRWFSVFPNNTAKISR